LNGSVSQFLPKYEAAQLFSTLTIIINLSRASNHHIRVISEGSWSNDAENSALITEINCTLLYIHIENRYFTL